jgi:hypothetical protein
LSVSDLWLTTILEEYKALRSEITTSIAAQQSILSFGTATVALVFGPGLGLWQRSELSVIIIFNALVPLMSATVLVIWWGEVLRMVRAGEWLAVVEQRVNAYGKDKLGWTRNPLTWESYLRPLRNDLPYRDYVSKLFEYKPPYVRQFVINVRGVILAFWIIALASGALGFFSDHQRNGGIRTSTIAISSFTAAGMVVSLVFMWSRWRFERKRHDERTKDFLSAKAEAAVVEPDLDPVA